MTESTQAVLFNALPLLLLAAGYAAVTGAVLPGLWRGRRESHVLDWAVVLVFAGVALAGLLLGGVVLHDRRPVGGQVWVSLAGTLIALAPAVLLLSLWRHRELVVGGIARTRRAEERVSTRDREIESVAEMSTTLGRARDPVEVARPLVRRVAELLDVGFAAVVLVAEDGRSARGLYGESGGEVFAPWFDIALDLRNEPSGIATAVFDAAPVTVFDVKSSPLVSPRLVGLIGAQSGAFVPLVAEERVTAVLVIASTDRKRAFSPDELSLLQAIAGEAALALDRLRSADALADALVREQTAARIAHAVRDELEPERVAEVAQAELKRVLDLDAVEIDLRPDAEGGVPILAGSERVGVLRVQREAPLGPGEELLVETAALDLGAALQTAWLVAENRRRIAQQAALLSAAQVVTSELELEPVLRRLVEEVTKLLGADAADCYLLDRERGVLRCAAVHGFDPSLVGFEFAPGRGESELAEVVPHDAYAGFTRSLVVPMTWAGETRGVLGVGVRQGDPSFGPADVELLEAFASLASLALRNAESYAERSRQARVQRGFYRIAALLGESLSLDEAYDAAAQAAAEALGADHAAVLMRSPGGLALVGGHELPPQVQALPVSETLVQAAVDGQMLASTHVADDERFDPSWRNGPFTSLLAIPIPGEPAGLVLVLFREERSLARDDLELAQQLASATRGALDRSRLFEAERAARSLSQQLARTNSLLATELDPAAVLEAVVTEAAELLGTDGAALASLAGDELVVTAAVGPGAETALGLRTPAAGRLAGDVVQTRAPVAVDDVAADRRLAGADPLLGAGYRAYLGVPLVGREGALEGVLAVLGQAPRAWRPDEVQALVALAANASSTLANAELYQRVAVEREQSLAILANIADGIVAVDRDGEVVVWNRAAAEITGVPAREAIGRTPVQVLQRDLQSGTGAANRLVSIMRGAEEVWLSLSEAVMRDPTGAVAGRIYAFRDISDERAVEQMKSDFVSTVSHELRTPLTSIYGFAQTLLREDIVFGEVERRTFMSYIARESERLTTIVDALLDVARLDAGGLRVSSEPIDIATVVGDVVAGVEPDGHEFVADVAESGLRAQADPAKVRQVLDQLISNAIKYSPAGGTVTVSARRRPDAVEVAVSDQGAGVPVGERERIFSKFYKAGDEARGTGLGLFIAQGLVREMGGRIWVDSQEGSGSRFTFELPLADD
ncbi:MAG TPA: GAF domain-containing protein [Gaiellaceae bacterium]|nr:GAF domain-containing protein [Gaiellaceae bacterium]